MSVGYSGVAYLRDSDRNLLPTDHFIAQVLAGRSIANPPHAIAVTLGGTPKQMDVGLAAKKLCEETQAAFGRLRPLHHRWAFRPR